MNKAGRKRLRGVLLSIIAGREIIEEIVSEEQEKFDNLPEGLQSSEKGEKIEEGISVLEEIVTAAEQIEESLEEIVGDSSDRVG